MKKRLIAGAVAASALSLGAMTEMAAAQGPVITGGLVNVTITDAVDVGDVTVQVPVSAAVNLCDIDVNVLAADLADDGEANCTATATSRARA